jgi:hypothetical protein
MVVLPALSNPLVVRGGGQRQPSFGAHDSLSQQNLQHENPHFFIFESCFA